MAERIKMLKEGGHLLQLDEVEKGVVQDFLSLLDEQKFPTKILVLSNRIHRTVEGIIVVPVSLNGVLPSLSLALLMDHKSDQLYKQTSCRVRLAQCPTDDPKKGMYVWGDSDWQTLS